MKVIVVGGVFELCGAVVYNNAQLRPLHQDLLRNSHFKANEKRVFKGLHYFFKAKRVEDLDSGHANCRSTGVNVPKSKVNFGFDFPKNQRRVN